MRPEWFCGSFPIVSLPDTGAAPLLASPAATAPAAESAALLLLVDRPQAVISAAAANATAIPDFVERNVMVFNGVELLSALCAKDRRISARLLVGGRPLSSYDQRRAYHSTVCSLLTTTIA